MVGSPVICSGEAYSEREAATGQLGEFGHRLVGVAVEHAGDAEVEQLDLTVAGDQHV